MIPQIRMEEKGKAALLELALGTAWAAHDF